MYQNTKYTLSRMIPTKCDAAGGTPTAATATVADLYATKNDLEVFALWDLQNFYAQTQARFLAKAKALNLPNEANTATETSFASAAAGDHRYDDAHVATQQFYCNTCHVQLASDKEVALHTKGKRHKNKLRDVSAGTVSEQIARQAMRDARMASVAVPV